MSCTIHLNDVVNIQADDVAFWLGQFAEHAEILARLLNAEAAPRLAEEAGHLAAKFREELARGNGQYDAMVILKFFAFLAHLKHMLHKIHKIVMGMKVKHFCRLVKHFLFELTYFVRLANGKIQVWEDIAFWVFEAIGHMRLFSALMDEQPERKMLRMKMEKLMCVWKLVKHHPRLLKLLLAELAMHGEMIGRVRGYIRGMATYADLDLVLHEMRETDRGIARIKFFLENLDPMDIGKEAKHKHMTVVAKEEVIVIASE
jgi:hypothetical protein